VSLRSPENPLRSGPLRVTLVITVAAALVAAANASARFTPRTLSGTWSGTWTNQTFGSSGPATVVAKSLADNTKLRFSVDFGGGVFGCASVPPEATPALPKGSGPNHWGAAGFTIKGRSKDFGTLTLDYRAASGNLRGSGMNPPCAQGLSWTMIGAFVGSKFSGKVKIKLASGQTAISDISLTRE
jgi:hypothetical protein